MKCEKRRNVCKIRWIESNEKFSSRIYLNELLVEEVPSGE